VQLLQNHFPYHESDHVLNIAYNAMTDGTCLEDLKRKRADEVRSETWRCHKAQENRHYQTDDAFSCQSSVDC
jgi:hypothetical protein